MHIPVHNQTLGSGSYILFSQLHVPVASAVVCRPPPLFVSTALLTRVLSGALFAALATARSATGGRSTHCEAETLRLLRSALKARNPMPTFCWRAGQLLQQLQFCFHGMTYCSPNKVHVSLMSKVPRIAQGNALRLSGDDRPPRSLEHLEINDVADHQTLF